MPFQILTGQWSKLYTHKFRVFFDEFTLSTFQFYKFPLVTLTRTTEVIGVKIYVREQAVRASTTSSILGVSQEGLASITQYSQARYTSTQCMMVPAENRGIVQGLLPRVNNSIAPPSNYFSNQESPTEISAFLNHAGASGNPLYTAGYADIWIITMKMP